MPLVGALALAALGVAGLVVVLSSAVRPCSDRPQDPICVSVGGAAGPAASSKHASLAPASASEEPGPAETPPWAGAPEATIDPAVTPMPDSTPVPGVSYSFHDEFDGNSLDPQWGRYWGSLGISTLSHEQTSVGDGVLTIAADRTPTGWRSDLIDSFESFRQTYGVFEARIKIPEGRGLWPAFWLAQDWKVSASEFDIMEICANPPGTNRGNDVTVLHQIIHAPDASDPGLKSLRTKNLSLDWHTYGMEWRPDRVVFTFDGAEVWRFTDRARIPKVPMAVLLSLELGSWCGRPNETTPSHAEMQVDWIRVQP